MPHGPFYLPCHHKSRKVRHMKLLLHVNRDVNAKANERKQETGRHEWEPESSEVARESQDQKHHRTGNIRRNRIQVRFDRFVPQPANDLRQKELHRLQGNTETDLDTQDEPARRVLEYSKRVFEIEFLVDDGGAVGLHAIVGEVFLLLGEKASIRSRLRKVPEGEE